MNPIATRTVFLFSFAIPIFSDLSGRTYSGMLEMTEPSLQTDNTPYSLTNSSETDNNSFLNTSSNYTNSCESVFTLIKNIQISKGEIFRINPDILSNMGSSALGKNPATERIYLETSSRGNYVECLRGAEFSVGGGPKEAVYQAQADFRNNSTLELYSGSTLRVLDNCRLVIHEGSALILHPGANIYLEGENAVLEIHGRIKLYPGTTFTFTKGNAVKGGFLLFNLNRTNQPFETPLSGCHFELEGDTWFPDKLIELVGDTKICFNHLNEHNGWQRLKLKNGIVDCNGDNLVDVYCSASFDNIHFRQQKRDIGTGLVTHGQSDLNISQCRFSQFETGMKAYNDDLGFDLIIKDSRFEQNSEGLTVFGKSLTLKGCTFHGNTTFGLFPDGLDNIFLDNTHFEYNWVGLETSGPLNHICCRGSRFIHNDWGIHDVYETLFTLKCASFEQNGTAIESNGILNLSDSIILPNQIHSAGNNTFFQNDLSISMHGGEVHLKNGNNNFLSGTLRLEPYNYLTGNINSSSQYASEFQLDASNNYFEHLPTEGIALGKGTLYTLQGTVNGLNLGAITLKGICATDMYTACFNFPRINPSKRKEPEHLPETSIPEYTPDTIQVIVFPNPSSGSFGIQIEYDREEQTSIRLTDTNGRLIWNESLFLESSSDLLLYYSGLPLAPGIYILGVETDSGITHTQKLIVTHTH